MKPYIDKRGLPVRDVQLALFDIPAVRRPGFTWESLLSKAEDLYLDGEAYNNQVRREYLRQLENIKGYVDRVYTALLIHESYKLAFYSPRYKRDRAEFDKYMKEGRCWVCQRIMGEWTEDRKQWIPGLYVGHLIDRARGGTNLPDNLRPMCGYCNDIKPLHYTLEEVMSWRDAIYEQIRTLGYIGHRIKQLAEYKPEYLPLLAYEAQQHRDAHRPG